MTPWGQLAHAPRMANMRRRATYKIDSFDMVGNRLRVMGHFSRTGIQIYKDGMGGERREYRSPDQVFADASLSSLAGMPVTVKHPRGVGGQVTPQNWRKLAARGDVVGNTGDNIVKAQDGTHTEGPIWVHDDATILRIQRRELTELSVGYTARLVEEPGTSPDGERYDARQENILGNHIALLEGGEARGGPTVRILDAEGHVRFDDGDADGDTPQEKKTMKVKVIIDGYEYTVEVSDDSNFAQAWEKLQDKIKADAKRFSEQEAELDALKEDKQKLQGKLDAATSPQALAQAAEARSKLVVDAKRVAGKDVPNEGSDLDIKKAALEARGIKLDGKDDTYINMRFEIILEDAAETPSDDLAPHRDAADQLQGGGSTPVKLTDEQLSFTRIGG